MLSQNNKAMLWVETSAGGGHMQVASQLSRALQNNGMEVDLFTGSMEIGCQYDFGKVTLHELPFIKPGGKRMGFDTIHGSYSIPGLSSMKRYLMELEEGALTRANGSSAIYPEHINPWDCLVESLPYGAWRVELRRYLEERQNMLRSYISEESPPVVITEFWPLGRSKSDAELSPFMQHLKGLEHPPLTVSLERDVLLIPPLDPDEEKRGMKDRRVRNTNRYIDEVIVRGDDSVIRLEDTLPAAREIEKPVFYAGYFATPLPPRSSIPFYQREVIVSAGGGFRPQDIELYEAAIRVRQHTDFREHRWRLFITPNCPEEDFLRLKNLASKYSPDILVERNCTSNEFKQHLADAALSISQGGYNTTLEVAAAHMPAVVIPANEYFSEEGEQLFRARRFEEIGRLSVVDLKTATNPDLFAMKIRSAVERQKCKTDSDFSAMRLNGAEYAARHIIELMSKRSEPIN